MNLEMVGTFFEYLIATVSALTGLGVGVWIIKLILTKLFNIEE